MINNTKYKNIINAETENKKLKNILEQNDTDIKKKKNQSQKKKKKNQNQKKKKKKKKKKTTVTYIGEWTLPLYTSVT